MADETLKIEELHLRVPGLSTEEGRSLGEEVARHVGDGLSSQIRLRHLGALDLHLTVPPGTPRTQMASVIAEAILKGLV